ncbi:MAG: dTDP-4-dehydrorhamnose 3,5-epimerase [Lentisphaerae bacterium GWF2_52_8]|nr:MAG: dTDP-4-dehydrorhamnose 3,5-epimerase [Lentisphaerae bacterium GWF2_52_8]
MKVNEGKLKGTLLIEPKVFRDARGYFFESYSAKKLAEYGIKMNFVQDNCSYSVKNTLRGLHYQIEPNAQDKLVHVTAGEVFDVVVDVRRNSPGFGQWESFILSAENNNHLFVPKGFAHGFCVLSDFAGFVYKCSSYYSPPDERGLLWNDPDLNIPWPTKNPILSPKDKILPRLKDSGKDF